MYKEQIEAYFADKEQMLVDAVCRLVSIDSVEGEPAPGAPFGPGPAAALDEALKLAGEWGLITTNHEGYVGTADLNTADDALHILGHLDVVAPGEGWTITEPYSPKVMDGMIYGRGTDDDKGPLVASLLAMKAVKDLGIPLTKNCRCILGTNEESGSGDIAWYFARHPFAPATFSPDSGFPVVNTEKGGLKPLFTASWPEQQELPRLAWLHGGIRINVLPGDASAAIEGLSIDDVHPFARDITARTGIKFTLSLEEGLTVIRAKGTGSHAAWPEGGNNAVTGLISLLCSLPLAEGPCKDYLNVLNTLMPHGDYYGKALGIAQGAIDECMKYVKERVQFGKPIWAFQNTQFQLADMQTKVDAARLLVYRAAQAKQDGEPYGHMAAMAKLFASETASDVTRRTLQLIGGYGYTREYPFERFMRDAKITEIYEGTSEVQRMVIAGWLGSQK